MMCGLFGWIGENCDPVILSEIANLAARRGPDCCGIFLDGEIWRGTQKSQHYDWEGRNGRRMRSSYLPVPPRRIVIGHYRLGTGLPSATVEIQPLSRGSLVLAHNGSIANYEQLVAEYGLELETGIDSEALLALIARAEGNSLQDRLKYALDRAAMGPAWALALTDGRDLLLVNHYLGLFLLEQRTEIYWCSVQPTPEWEALVGTKKVGLTFEGAQSHKE